MSATFTIAGRELRSMMRTLGPYAVCALFLLFVGIVFAASVFQPGRPASLQTVFQLGTWVLLLVGPALGMGAISDERRLGTLEMLMTSPVSELQIVLGKFIGGLMFLVLMILPTVLHVVVLELYGRPDYGELLCGYGGLLLAGSAYLASGMLASALTASPIVALLMALFFWLILSLSAKILPAYLPEQYVRWAFLADPEPRLQDFAIGLVDSANIVYFATLTLLFLAVCVKCLAWRKWR